MRFKSFSMAAAGLALAALASGQTKISGTLECGKPDPMQKIDVGDHPGHALAVSKSACTWTKSMDIEGAQTKTGTSVGTGDANGSKMQVRGYHSSEMSSGDKFYVRYQGTDTYGKDGKPVASDGTWSFSGGTGKLKGIKGKGTYKGKPTGDDKMTYEVEGDYQIATAKK